MRIPDALREFRHRGDSLLFILCMLASLYGLTLIYSATRYAPSLHSAVWKQACALLIGIAAFLLLNFIDVESLLEQYWKILPFFNFGLLLLLVPFGNDNGTGNKSWLSIPGTPFNLQPAEIIKLTFVLLLALQFSRLRDRGVSRPFSILQTAGHTLLFCGFIWVVSGDMGMILVYLFIFLIMAWAAGVRFFWFAAGLAGAAGTGVLLWPRLPSYVQGRMLVVLNHNLDPLGKGFQQTRSLLSIGSGQILGQGYLHGLQTQSTASSSLPARHTDFIFSVAGEELGLWGCLLILLLLGAIVLRCLQIARTAHSPLCCWIAVGYGGMLAVQTLLNVGMCLFTAPVVGLTLPFFSYGGSSLVTLFVAMGILSGIWMRSRPGWLRDRG